MDVHRLDKSVRKKYLRVEGFRKLTTGEMCPLTSVTSPPCLLPPRSQRIFGIRLTIDVGRRWGFRLLIGRRGIAVGSLRLIRIGHVFLVGVIKVDFIGRRGIVGQDSIQGGGHIYVY